jgi:hypothetical protein
VTGTSSFTITAAPATDNLYSSSPFSLKLHVVLADYNAVTAVDISFTVNVSRYTCTSSTTYTPTPAAMITAYTYTIGAAAHTIEAPTFTSSPYTCGETVTYSLTKQDGLAAPGCVTFDASTRVITIYTTDTSYSSNILLRVIVTRNQGNS